jgi:hypothetical protein
VPNRHYAAQAVQEGHYRYCLEEWNPKLRSCRLNLESWIGSEPRYWYGRRYDARYVPGWSFGLDSTTTINEVCWVKDSADIQATGTTLVDSLKLFFDHPETEGIIVIGEIGGEAELRAAEAIKEYRRTTKNPKPIIAMVAGKTAPEGRTMGHAGALLQSGDISAEAKAKALEDSGAIVVPHPGVMGQVMNELLVSSTR